MQGTSPSRLATWLVRIFPVLVGAVIWAVPAPTGLAERAWHLFAIFAAAIVAVVAGTLPILTASLIAGALAVLTGTLPPAEAYAGFSEGFLLLILVAFLVARAVVNCVLGRRIA